MGGTPPIGGCVEFDSEPLEAALVIGPVRAMENGGVLPPRGDAPRPLVVGDRFNAAFKIVVSSAGVRTMGFAFMLLA